MASSSFPAHVATTPSPRPAVAERQASRVRRRNRLITSCLECRRRKLKCDKGQPCSNCAKISRQCVFIAPSLDPDAQARLTEVKEKMGNLEKSLEEDVARRIQARRSSTGLQPAILPGQEESYSDQEDEDDAKNLDPTHLALEDAVYHEEESNDDMLDLGIAMGKVRINERVGGLVYPKFSEELAQALRELPKREHSDDNSSRAHDRTSWSAPSRDYVAPSSSLFFASGIEKTNLMTYLPAKVMVDKLIAHYWNAVHIVARTVHRPSFERQYYSFWANINAGIEPRTSFQAVVFAALLSSIISMSEDAVLAEFGASKQTLVDNFREGTESALSRANFLRTTKLETLQAFLMYLIPLCRNEVSRAHSALTGSLIRLAECMGLHRDPTNYSSSPIEIHVRRLIWYQICFLDLRTCEATGPRPQIRPDDYDTRFPANIDDVAIDLAEHGSTDIDVSKDRKHFTDMTITRMRFESYEMHRTLWFEWPKLYQKNAEGERKVTLATLLTRIQSFCAAMEKIYLPMLSNTVPLHVLAAEMYGILSNRLYIMVLQRYLSNDRCKLPERLRQIVLSAAIMILEHSMTIEQQPALAMWSWYLGALHQYHVALLLSNELYAGPRDPAMEKRVWRGLDFTFGLPEGISNIEKMRMILEDLIQKTKVYADMRKFRAPTNLTRPLSRVQIADQQGRQQEAQEPDELGEGALSESHSNSSPAFDGHSQPDLQQPAQYQRLRQQPQLLQTQQSNPSPGVMPNTDWGISDVPIVLPSAEQRAANLEKFAREPTALSASLLPAQLLPDSCQYYSIDDNIFSSATYGTTVGGISTINDMDALNDIDWNDIEGMFGGAEIGAGNMLIPPFTFPQFSATDL